jgi:hypothetical protein
MSEQTAPNSADVIIAHAWAAKTFMECADVKVASDESLVRAAVAYNMLVRRGVIRPPADELDLPHAIATIAANFDDVPADTPHRAALFATSLGERRG